MWKEIKTAELAANWTVYNKQTEGHYESYFLRANHPEKPQAFWFRYTIFSPANKIEDAIAELWAIYFDGEQKKHLAFKKELPISEMQYSNSSFSVKMKDAVLNENFLQGSIEKEDSFIGWNLSYTSQEKPLFLFPHYMYGWPIPKAKSLVPLPLASFTGKIILNGKEINIENWLGSQNHNWGSKHTDHYAWGQVAGFDNAPDTFLEVATARLKIGPFWTPFMTPIVLRHKGKEYKGNHILHTLANKGNFNYFNWNFESECNDFLIKGSMKTQAENVVGLSYYNPPGGVKYCLNTKIAECELTLTDKHTKITETFTTKNRAAFEILTDENDHGIELQT